MYFLPLVKTSQKFCELLNVHGLRAVEVNGSSTNREEILKDFENGEYDVLCNSMLLTEGWDCPSVDTIVVLRPTKVRSLYQQMVGRGMRLSPGKKELLLLDFLWMTERHDLCKPSSLLSKDEEIAKRINQKMMDKESGIDLLEAEKDAESDVIKEREESLARELAAMKKRKSKLVDPIRYAFSIAAEDLANYEPAFTWEMGPATERQLSYLEKQGIHTESVTCFGMASMLIDKLKSRQVEGLATPKQIRLLEKYGFNHVGMWPFDLLIILIKCKNCGSNFIFTEGEQKFYASKGFNVPSKRPNCRKVKKEISNKPLGCPSCHSTSGYYNYEDGSHKCINCSFKFKPSEFKSYFNNRSNKMGCPSCNSTSGYYNYEDGSHKCIDCSFKF